MHSSRSPPPGDPFEPTLPRRAHAFPLLLRQAWLGAPEFILSDSGNQVIRAVDQLGRVRTVAGTPGQAGYHDDPDPRKALGNDPRGLAVDPAGTIYVADRGNQVVRRISSEGAVSTLAGQPGRSGSSDGRGAGALFSELKGLVVRPSGGICVVDGHSVRSISPEGDVATLLGNPLLAGTGPDGTGSVLPGEPCLNHPEDMAVWGADFVITDRGNHALRLSHPASLAGPARIATLAGDPKAPALRYGLLRFGIEGPVGPEFGALGAPMGIAVHGRDLGGKLAGTEYRQGNI